MLTHKEESYSADKFKVNVGEQFDFDYEKRNASLAHGKWKGP